MLSPGQQAAQRVASECRSGSGRHGSVTSPFRRHSMGIVASCPNGHRIKVKDELAGKKGICPTCHAKFRIPVKPVGTEPQPAAGGGLPTARVVSLDPLYAASLATAHPIEEADTVGASASAEMEAANPQPDFVLVSEAEPDPTPAHAVLDERPDLAWCVAVRGGAPSAPLAVAALRAWLDSGAATADHVVWRADWPEWRPLAEVFPDALPARSPGWP